MRTGTLVLMAMLILGGGLQAGWARGPGNQVPIPRDGDNPGDNPQDCVKGDKKWCRPGKNQKEYDQAIAAVAPKSDGPKLHFAGVGGKNLQRSYLMRHKNQRGGNVSD